MRRCWNGVDFAFQRPNTVPIKKRSPSKLILKDRKKGTERWRDEGYVRLKEGKNSVMTASLGCQIWSFHPRASGSYRPHSGTTGDSSCRRLWLCSQLKDILKRQIVQETLRKICIVEHICTYQNLPINQHPMKLRMESFHVQWVKTLSVQGKKGCRGRVKHAPCHI